MKSHALQKNPGACKVLPLVVLAVVSAIAVFNVWRFTHQIVGGSWGIDYIWRSLNLFAQGANPYEIYLDETRSGVNHLGTPNYLVPGLMSMVPLGIIADAPSRWLWMLLNLGFGAAILCMLQKRYPLERFALLLATLLFAGAAPLRVVLLNSQTTLYVLFLFFLSAGLARRVPWFAGLLLTLSLMKYSVTLPLSIWYLLDRGRWGVVSWAVGWQLGLTALAAAWTGSGFFDILLGPVRLTAAGGVAMSSVATDFFSICHHVGINSMVIPGVLAMIAMLVVLLLLLPGRERMNGIERGEARRDEDLGILAVLSALACLIFFHLPYDHVTLLPVFWWGWRIIGNSERRVGGGILGLVVLIWLPKEVFTQLADALAAVVDVRGVWWGLGIGEMMRFGSLVGLLVLTLRRQQACRPSFARHADSLF